MRGIVVTTENICYVQDFSDPMYKTVGAVLGGPVEVVRPRGLQPPFVMMCDEEGLLKDHPALNFIGSYFYGTQNHGNPIVGNIVIMKMGYDERTGEQDIVGLDESEIQQIIPILKFMGAAEKKAAT